MKKIFAVLGILAVLCPAAEAMSRRLVDVAPPRLIEPTDIARLDGGQMKFRWTTEGNSTADYYDFRLYKGTQTVESGLLLKERVPRDKSELIVPGERFSIGESYTWSVRQVGSRKSKSSYSIFKLTG